MSTLPAQPEFRYGVYRNKKMGQRVASPSMIFNAENGIDEWWVYYFHLTDDDMPEDNTQCTRSISHFYEKFEYIGSMSILFNKPLRQD